MAFLQVDGCEELGVVVTGCEGWCLVCGKGRQYKERALNHRKVHHRRAHVLEGHEYTMWLEPGFRKGMQWAADCGQVVEGADQGEDTAVQEDAIPLVHFAKK